VGYLGGLPCRFSRLRYATHTLNFSPSSRSVDALQGPGVRPQKHMHMHTHRDQNGAPSPCHSTQQSTRQGVSKTGQPSKISCSTGQHNAVQYRPAQIQCSTVQRETDLSATCARLVGLREREEVGHVLDQTKDESGTPGAGLQSHRGSRGDAGPRSRAAAPRAQSPPPCTPRAHPPTNGPSQRGRRPGERPG